MTLQSPTVSLHLFTDHRLLLSKAYRAFIMQIVNSLMWSSCMLRNEQKEMVHLYRSLTLSDAPKEIKLMGLYPIALGV